MILMCHLDALFNSDVYKGSTSYLVVFFLFECEKCLNSYFFLQQNGVKDPLISGQIIHTDM
jgi:hypothetical protein